MLKAIIVLNIHFGCLFLLIFKLISQFTDRVDAMFFVDSLKKKSSCNVLCALVRFFFLFVLLCWNVMCESSKHSPNADGTENAFCFKN